MRATATRICAICERSLLLGEHAIRYSPGRRRVRRRLRALLGDRARVRLAPRGERSRSRPSSCTRGGAAAASAACSAPPRAEEAPVADEPILRRLSEPELALVEAADLFNLSQHRRTVAGVAKSLGAPQASIIPLSGVTGEMIVTVAWEISWYQYRVSPDSPQPVRLVERGHDIEELEDSYQSWNAQLADDGRLMPDIARI